MIAAEMLADGRKRAVGQLAAQVHRDLAAECDVLRALLRLQIGQPDMEKIRDRLLDRFDVGLRFVIANQIAAAPGARTPR